MRRQTHTTVEATFYRHGRDPLVVDRGLLVSADVSVRLGQATSWSLELKAGPRVGWASLVAQGDWVKAVVLKDGRRFLLFAGIVSVVRLQISAGSTGEGSVVYRVEGIGLDGPLDLTPVYFNPYDPLNDNALGISMLRILQGAIAGTADEVVLPMIRGMMGADGILGGHTRVPAGFTRSADAHWVDILDTTTVVQTGLRGRVNAAAALTSVNAPSVRSFVASWCNPVLNELWIDTAPADVEYPIAYLHLRERPFVNATEGADSPWFRLPAWDVDANTLTSADLSQGEGRVNHLTVTGDLAPTLGTDAYALYPPIVDVRDVDAYGLRRLEHETRYYDEGSADDFGKAYREWYSLILSWNVLAHRYWSGRLTIGELRPELRVGQKLRVLRGPLAGCPDWPADGGDPDKALSFYIEGIQHRWMEGERPMAQTQAMVSRGFVEGQRADAVRVRHDDFTGLADLTGVSADTDVLTGSEGAASGTAGGRYS